MAKYVLVDKFKGFLSDFADDTVYSVLGSPDAIIDEIHARLKALKPEHIGIWGRRALKRFPRKSEIRRLIRQGKPVRMMSIDKCEYTWSIHRAV